MKQSKISTLAAATTGAAICAAPGIAAACATCGIGDGPEAGAYNASAIFLLAGPYVTFGTIAGIIYFAYRRAARREKIARAALTVKQ
ncbi:MAG TPA: hypothetical protein VMU16_02825 [Candidatus Binataceae bacterium]|nr:hypothetical protein [Candidatus Binataceae bacterium]